MYKKHAKFFSRSNQLAGLEEIYPGLANAQKRREKVVVTDRPRRRRPVGTKQCEICRHMFEVKEFQQHMYRAHKFWMCGNCKSFVPKDTFEEHLREIHGKKALKTWLGRRKPKKND